MFVRKNLALVAALFLAFCLNVAAGEPRTVKDMRGNVVELPEKVSKVASLWNANNQIILAIGEMDKVVAIEGNAKNKWFLKVYPRIAEIVSGRNSKTSVQIEELLKLAPDVVFSSDMQEQLEKNGFKVVNVRFRDFEGMRRSIELTAEVIGANAPKKAAELNGYIEKNIALLSAKTDKIAPESRPKVLHIADGKNLLKVDGTGTIVDMWIKLAGGVNAVQKDGFKMEMSAEELININPDIIIVGGADNQTAVEKIYAHPAYAGSKAVANKKVFGNPSGVFTWDRYGAEAALQILWAGTVIQPGLFTDIDVKAETKAFYKKFMNYELSDAEFGYILHGLGPDGSK